ncbi:hypothetical protein PsYK624_127960 [Phanerochaete sordida]|uniref:Uncharacterized protein n=1 Tax=Phanerochaete sordida TaxID=48140 RepID=A0A9P3LJV6_9APHY|nr:hypothetical protein PsYK624_127960 [Phanerochaete sordida]
MQGGLPPTGRARPSREIRRASRQLRFPEAAAEAVSPRPHAQPALLFAATPLPDGPSVDGDGRAFAGRRTRLQLQCVVLRRLACGGASHSPGVV